MDLQLIAEAKDGFAAQLDKRSGLYNKAVVRQLVNLYNSLPSNLSPEERLRALVNATKNFKLSATNQNIILKDVVVTAQEIAGIWDTYFPGQAIPEDYEKILAANKINFEAVNETISHIVKKEVLKAVLSGAGFNAIQSALSNSGLGFHQASTIANTYVAMFDNKYMQYVAAKAGIQYFIYDGILLNQTRPFCRERVGRVYTISELTAMNNSQGLPVEQALGGYNCTHFLTPAGDYNRKATGELYDPSHHF